MSPELERRIDEQDTWTFQECLGLAAEFRIKVRVVIMLVLARGKHYEDTEPGESGPD